jgi:hypothetical protein
MQELTAGLQVYSMVARMRWRGAAVDRGGCGDTLFGSEENGGVRAARMISASAG